MDLVICRDGWVAPLEVSRGVSEGGVPLEVVHEGMDEVNKD